MAKLVNSLIKNKINGLLFAILVILLITLAVVIPLVDVRHNTSSESDNSTTSLYNGSNYAVLKSNFPDPCVIKYDGTWYAFATRDTSIGPHIQIASAVDIKNWTLHHGQDALPYAGSWVQLNGDSQVWAPSVTRRDTDGAFVMYYSALHRQYPGRHCIGVAVSESITGPYIPTNTTLVCDIDQGGVIDPSYFRDPQTNISYLLYKDDGNAVGSGGACSNSDLPNTPTPFKLLQLNATLETPAVISNANKTNSTDPKLTILTNNPNDGPNIEGPQLWYHPYWNNYTKSMMPSYHLVYNSGCYADKSYRLKNIVCWDAESLDKCNWEAKKDFGSYPEGTILKTGDTIAGILAPGGPGISTIQTSANATVVDDEFMVFHADLNENWFQDPQHQNRTRGMFIMNVTYPIRLPDGIFMNGLVY